MLAAHALRVLAQTDDSWLRMLERNWPALIPLSAIVGGIAVVIVAIISKHMADVRRARLETELKQDMLDRGMSAEEIAQVVKAKLPR